jgi:hypothetical protein
MREAVGLGDAGRFFRPFHRVIGGRFFDANTLVIDHDLWYQWEANMKELGSQ